MAAVWADLPQSIRDKFNFNPGTWGVGTETKKTIIQNAIAEIYTVGAGQILINSLSGVTTINFSTLQFAALPDGSLEVDPSKITQNGEFGYINAQGYWVAMSIPELLFHEFVHVHNWADDDGVWSDQTTAVWDNLSNGAVDFQGPAVKQENVWLSQHDGTPAYLGRPSYLSTGYGNEIRANGSSWTMRDGAVQTVDHVVVDNLGSSRIDFSAFAASKDLVIAGLGNDVVLGGDGDDFLYGSANDDIVVGGEGEDVVFGDNLPGAPAIDGNDFLFGGDSNLVASGSNTTIANLNGWLPNKAERQKWLDGKGDQLFGGAGFDTYYVGGLTSDQRVAVFSPSGYPFHEQTINQAIYDYIDIITDVDGLGQIFAYSEQTEIDTPFGIRGVENDPNYLATLGPLTGTYNQVTFVDGDAVPNVWRNSATGIAFTFDAATNRVIFLSSIDTNRDVPPAALFAIQDFRFGMLGINGGGNPTPPPPNTPPPAPPTNTTPTVQGTSGADSLTGSAAADVIDAGAGDDTVNAQQGNDYITPGSGNDSIYGGDDFDTVSYAASSAAVDIDLQNYIGQIGGDAQGDVLASIESVVGTSLADSIRGSADNNYFTGGAGNDLLDGRLGSDILDGGAGSDTMVGGAGNDTFIVDNTADLITENAGEGTDLVQASVTYTLATNVESLTLTGATAINATGNTLANILTGNSADNVVDGGTGADTMIGGLGNDTYIVDSASDVVTEAVSSGTDKVRTSLASYTLSANLENLEFTGTGAFTGTGNASANDIRGGAGADTLSALDGNDTITGNGGNDTIDGGLGTDTLILSGARSNYTFTTLNATQTSVVDGRVGADGTDTIAGIENVQFADGTYALSTLLGSGTGQTINGTAGADNLVGTAGNDSLNGLGGDDTLNGGAGSDTMVGGLGNDTYVVDNSTDIVTEAAGEGTDTVQSSVTYTLSANVENLTLTGSSAINGTGNALANTLTGNSADNVLNGGAGADTMAGGLGNDTYVVDIATDVVTEAASAGSDTVQSSVTYTLSANIESLTLTGASAINGTGNTLANIITGNAADNILDGGVGADMLVGGLGNDTYLVDVTTEIVSEAASAGTDTVQSSATYTLAANIENLTLIGAAAINGTANTLDNVLTGNSATNTLAGGAGNDTYVVQNTTDTVTEAASEGTDTIQSSVTFTLAANVENLVLTGATAINGTGNTLDNVLTGNSATNTLAGGVGNDTYVVQNTTDVVTEAANEGADIVQSSVSYTLSANIESLTLTGASAISGTGNALANVITGNAADNVLDGGAGADMLVGGLGNDTYLVDATTEIVSEAASAGTDTVQSSATYTLAANLENLTLIGAAAINGTGNTLDNVLTGNSATNTLAGGAGNDTYVIQNTTDIVSEAVSAGTDTVQSSVTYTLAANVENLVLTGATAINGTGNTLDNVLTGNSATNTLAGGVGNDTYVIQNTTDVVTEAANEGTDTIQSLVTYTLSTNVENLTLTGATAINGTGNTLANILVGNSANNILVGGVGNDTLIGGGGADSLDGGQDADTASYELSAAGVYVHMLDTAQNTGDALGDTYANIENLKGTAFVDTLIATDLANTVWGGNGDDTILGLLGDDTLNGESGNDTIFGGDNNDSIFGGDGNDDLFGEAGNDRVDGGLGADYMIAGDGDDTLIGGLGGDTLDGGNGIDTASYENSTSGLYVQFSDFAQNTGEAFGDTYASVENLKGSAFDDRLITDDGANTIWGGDGADTILGLGSNDTLFGENGNDNIFAGDGNDIISGGSGADQLFGENGNDRLDGGVGDDFLQDSAGNDTFVMKAGYGSDFVSGFVAGSASGDVIELTGLGVSNFTQLQSHLTEGGGNTFINFSDGSLLTLESVSIAQLNSGDFVFL